nr:WecB/TagA/CpsF family glycosyltransferase [uncultured Merdimonas sp.]
MNRKINVLDIDIDNCSAKEALKKTIEYMDSVPVNTVEMVTVDGLMQMDDMPELKDEMWKFDLLMAGDKTILEAADVTEKRYLQEAEDQLFLRMFLRYLHKNHKRVYLLVESEEEGQTFFDYLQKHYDGVQVVGLAKVSAANRADDMLVNAINGGEVDCVIAALLAPLQEDFIIKNRNLLDVRLWLGIGKSTLPVCKNGFVSGKLGQFLVKYIFKREIEKRKQK